MKVEIEKYKADHTGFLRIFHGNPLKPLFETRIRKNYTYYIFRTEEKAWIRHSGKLTKEEKQWVIKNEQK